MSEPPGHIVRGDSLSGAVESGDHGVGVCRLSPAAAAVHDQVPIGLSRVITRRTVQSLMLALRAIVAADGRHPVPSSREHASASASRTRACLPKIGRHALGEHLKGDRPTSVLHEQIGEMLDRPGHTASGAEIREWLGRCSVSWKLSDDPAALKAELVAALSPRFNRASESPPTGVWWVYQGKSYDEESACGVVFAGSGAPQLAHHLNVGRMKPGDVVIHYRYGKVVAVGETVAKPVEAIRPYGPLAERHQGWLTRVEYFQLDDPIALADVPDRDGDEGPFNAAGQPKQGYLFALEPSFAARMREPFADRWPAGSPWASRQRRFWLFQANPRHWNLLDHLPQMPPGHVEDWTVTRHRNDMHPGDGVVLWQGGEPPASTPWAAWSARLSSGRRRDSARSLPVGRSTGLTW